VPAWFEQAPPGDDGPEGRLARSLVAAKRFLDAAAAADVLAGLPGGAPAPDRAALAAAEVDHVGLLAPAGARPLLEAAAERAGFTAGGIAFPSVLLARELAARTGRTRPTTVVKRFGHTPAGRRVAVEVFVAAYDDAELRRWIAEGVGVHVALAVAAPAFADALRILSGRGLAMPAFTDGRPHFIAGEDVTIAYFEHAHAAPARRLEVRGPGNLTDAGRARRSASG